MTWVLGLRPLTALSMTLARDAARSIRLGLYAALWDCQFRNVRLVRHSCSETKGTKMSQDFRQWSSGLLSKNASYQLFVTGHIGANEIRHLIKRLELEKEFLEEGERKTSEGEIRSHSTDPSLESD